MSSADHDERSISLQPCSPSRSLDTALGLSESRKPCHDSDGLCVQRRVAEELITDLSKRPLQPSQV